MANDSKADAPVQVRHRGGEIPDHQYLTLQQVAQWLNISRGTAWSIVIEKREIPYVRLSDRVVRVARADVEGYLQRCRSDAGQ